jgi:hypothetical protein
MIRPQSVGAISVQNQPIDRGDDNQFAQEAWHIDCVRPKN